MSRRAIVAQSVISVTLVLWIAISVYTATGSLPAAALATAGAVLGVVLLWLVL